MIASFTIQNETTGDTVRFGQTEEHDFLYEDGGVDWGNVSATHNTYNYPNQVGVSISSSKIRSRDISIEAYAYYIPNEEERMLYGRKGIVEYCYSKIREKKGYIDRIINPNDFLKVSVGGYYIEGKPSASVKYGKEDSDNNLYFCRFIILIFCANPMFKKDSIVQTTVAGSLPLFHFPWVIKNSGIPMGYRKEYLMLHIYNEGSVPIGGIIRLRATDTVKNPSITNALTGESLKIHKTMLKDEEIIIDTTDGRNRGIVGSLDGNTFINYLKYWSFTNAWIKFNQGDTILMYSTEDGSESSLKVTIEINPEKFALEDM